MTLPWLAAGGLGAGGSERFTLLPRKLKGRSVPRDGLREDAHALAAPEPREDDAVALLREEGRRKALLAALARSFEGVEADGGDPADGPPQAPLDSLEIRAHLFLEGRKRFLAFEQFRDGSFERLPAPAAHETADLEEEGERRKERRRGESGGGERDEDGIEGEREVHGSGIMARRFGFCKTGGTRRMRCMARLFSFGARRRIYLDHAAATPIDPAVARVLERVSREFPGNPLAAHAEGRAARDELDRARARAARTLGVGADEVIFTATATEANNLALLGVIGALAESGKKPHAVLSAIEHSSLLAPARELLRRGFAVTFVPPDSRGIVPAGALLRALRPETAFVSLMLVNNELGTIQPVAAVGRKLALRRRMPFDPPFLHTDASQGPLTLDCSPARLFVDLMTLDGQKIRGPKGVGLLFRRRGVPLRPLLFGGGQEGGARPGTESVALAAALAEALAEAAARRKERRARFARLKESFLAALRKRVPEAIVVGDSAASVPHIVNVSVPGRGGEFLAVALDEEGVAVSTKSACLAPERLSPVVRLVAGEEAARGALRFSFGDETTEGDLAEAVAALARILSKFDKQKEA